MWLSEEPSLVKPGSRFQFVVPGPDAFILSQFSNSTDGVHVDTYNAVRVGSTPQATPAAEGKRSMLQRWGRTIVVLMAIVGGRKALTNA